LSVSETTIEDHLEKIFEKLDVHTRIEMARKIRELVD
jgi:DNA-binding NarL/FixJ family response regulator